MMNSLMPSAKLNAISVTTGRLKNPPSRWVVFSVCFRALSVCVIRMRALL